MAATPLFSHVVFETNRLERMKDWYRDVLHAHVVYEGHNLCFLTFDEEHHRIAIIEAPDKLEPKQIGANGLHTSAGMHHVSYTFASLENLLERYAELKTKEIGPAVCFQHGVTTSMYYADPDSNLVELQIENFATPAEADAYMHGAEYDAFPNGPGYSPEALLAAFQAGVPVDQLTSRAWAERNPPASH